MRTKSTDDDELEDEPQGDQEVTKKSVVNPFEKVGQGFFTTDRGNPVYIEFSYSEEGDFAHFEYRPPVLEHRNPHLRNLHR